MVERGKIYSLQAVRGIAALAVVLYHVGSFVGHEPALWHRTAIYHAFYAGIYGVDIFFVLSGIVILTAHWNDIGKPERLRRFLWKRFRRIYPIYWVFLLPTVLKQLLVHGTNTAAQRNPYVLLSSFLLIHIRSLAVNLVVSWTLFHEVLFYLVFSLLLIHRRIGTVVCTAWIAASCLFFRQSAFSVEPKSYAEMLFSPLHILFAFGLLSGWLLKHKRAPSQMWVSALGAAVFCGCLALQAFHHAPSPWLRITAGAGATLLLVSVAERELTTRFRVPKFLSFLGDASYSIYLSHFLVVWFLSYAAFRLDTRLHLPVLLWTAAIFCVAVLVGVASHLLIERPLLRLFTERKEGGSNREAKALSEMPVAVP